jgi:uncharacterized protein (DUF2147 family)
MQLIKVSAFFILILMAGCLPARATSCDNIIGTWQNEDGRARVEIYKSGHLFYGKLVWLKEPLKNGKPKLDWKNPNPAKQSRPVIGLMIMRGFMCESYHVWAKGKIYDPESGNDYSCRLHLLGMNRLEVHGFVGISIIGRTDTWVRVSS